MQFYRKKEKSGGIPIVPLIDILTILLIFFIVHTQWKSPSSLLSIDVPGTEFIQGESGEEQRNILSVNKHSQILFLGEIVEPKGLPMVLSAFKEKNQNVRLQLDVDKEANFGTIVAIWDALTSAGIDVSDVPARIKSVLPKESKAR